MSSDVFAPQEYTLAHAAGRDERAAFIMKTYLHLLGAVIAFVLLEAAILMSPLGVMLTQTMLGGQYRWLIVLGAFMAVAFIANKWAESSTSLGMQYAGLGLYVVAEAVIFAPLLFVAVQFGGPQILGTAGMATLATFTGLTAIVVFTRKNFSFLGPALGICGIVALGVIVCSILFGFSLGILFTVLMIGFACGWILYDTSRILHEYRIGQHVAASLALFAAVALLFWYILRLVMILQRD